MFICFLILVVFLLVGSLLKSLGVPNDEDGNCLKNAFWSTFYFTSAIATFSGSTIFILNVEFKNFLLRRFAKIIIFDTRTYFHTSRNKVLPGRQEVPGREGMKRRQKSVRRSELSGRMLPQEDQQHMSVLNEKLNQIHRLDSRKKVDQEPRQKPNIIPPSNLILVREAEHRV